MSIDKIVGALNQRSPGIGNPLFFPGQDDFASTLTIGQVIKAKVLRHHEGSRYVADINGQQKVVDSANPLRPGELIEGRVKSLGKQVELQRITVATNQYRGDPNAAQTAEQPVPTSLLTGKNKPLLAAQQFFSDRQSNLTVNDSQVLKHFLSRGIALDVLLLASLSLKKAGFELNKETVNSVLKSLGSQGTDKASAVSVPTIALDVEATATQSVNVEVTKQLATDIHNQSKLAASLYASYDATDKQSFFGDSGKENLTYKMLNRQDDSSVNHQLMVFPIWLGDKLIEVSMAFFDQQKNKHNESTASPYKRFVFTLELDQLGDVVAAAMIHGKHITIDLTTANSHATQFLSQHMGELIRHIEGLGWVIDKVEYSTLQNSEMEPAVVAIVEHYATKDSVSRVF